MITSHSYFKSSTHRHESSHYRYFSHHCTFESSFVLQCLIMFARDRLSRLPTSPCFLLLITLRTPTTRSHPCRPFRAAWLRKGNARGEASRLEAQSFGFRAREASAHRSAPCRAGCRLQRLRSSLPRRGPRAWRRAPGCLVAKRSLPA